MCQIYRTAIQLLTAGVGRSRSNQPELQVAQQLSLQAADLLWQALQVALVFPFQPVKVLVIASWIAGAETVADNIVFLYTLRLIGIGLMAMFIINGGIMLISQSLWFKLPEWFRGSGAMTKARYSSSWGALEVRVLGAMFLLIVGWVAVQIVRSIM
jgi:hypothetical protein